MADHPKVPIPALDTLTAAASLPFRPFAGMDSATSSGSAPAGVPVTAVMAPASSETHPFYIEIRRIFYNFQLAHFNERIYSAFLDRAEKKYRRAQVGIAVLTVIAAASFMIPVALDDSQMVIWVHRLNPIAAILSFIAFLISVVAPILGWENTIDDLKLRVNTWHFAENQIETALVFLIHNAKEPRDADVAARFADSAYTAANNLLQVGSPEKKLFDRIQKEVETAFPPEYPWTAL